MAHHTNDVTPCPLCEEKLVPVHAYMREWFYRVKAVEKNVHISCGQRTEAEQEAAFKSGLSKVHFPDSKHNKSPAEALDLFFLTEDGVAVFPQKRYAKINDFNVQNKETVRWGGTFKTLGDANHFELTGVTVT